jgi:BioD-like phosphotransacetylase family protein
MVARVEADRELLFIEGGREIGYGLSVHLDALSLARHTGGTLILVLAGDEGTILDDAHTIKRHLDLEGVRFGGVILNKIPDVEDFQATQLAAIRDLGVPVLGLLPQEGSLTRLSLGFLADSLFAKVIAGEAGLAKPVTHIFVGAMSTDAAMRNPFFTRPQKLVITSGDRSDMILAALQGDSVGIVLTNNILPPTNLIALAGQRGVPLLLVAADTYQTAKQVDDIELLLTPTDTEKIDRLARLAAERLDLEALAGA